MIDFLKRLLQAPRDDEHDEVGVLLRHPGDGIVRVAGETFDLASLADRTEHLPHPRWSRAHRWLASLPEAQRHDAWVACERAGVAWLRDVLGDGYAVHESAHALLLTTQRARQASLTLAFIEDAKQRVSELLEELAQPPDSGKEILLLFHDQDQCVVPPISLCPEAAGRFVTRRRRGRRTDSPSTRRNAVTERPAASLRAALCRRRIFVAAA